MDYINKINLTGILAFLVAVGNTILPIVPQVWANLISALIGLYTFYHVGNLVKVARASGVKGI